MTNQIPFKPHHLFPPKKITKHRIPHQATMDLTKSFASVHQSSAWNSAPTPMGAVSIFGGASQIKSKDLTDFRGFWSQQMARHGGMVFWCFVFLPPYTPENIQRPARNNRGFKAQVSGDFAGVYRRHPWARDGFPVQWKFCRWLDLA